MLPQMHMRHQFNRGSALHYPSRKSICRERPMKHKHPVVIYNLTRMEATRFSRGAKGRTINLALYLNFMDVIRRSITINGFPQTFRNERHPTLSTTRAATGVCMCWERLAHASRERIPYIYTSGNPLNSGNNNCG